jgi:hypothetical protein
VSRIAGLTALLCAASLLAARPALALDPFEIQVYDGTADARGAVGLELHANHVFSGLPTAEAPELPADGQTHLTLEPSYGLFDFLELGGYFQTALRPSGQFDYAGVKLRAKLVLPKPPRHWRFGVNVELSLLPRAYERERWGTEVRPIVAFENQRWLMAVNPILDLSYTGPVAGKGPELEPAAMLKLKLEPLLALGIEYYAALGPVGALASPKAQQHYLFEAADLLALHDIELNVGVGEGLTDASNAWVAKMILGYTWE